MVDGGVGLAASHTSVVSLGPRRHPATLDSLAEMGRSLGCESRRTRNPAEKPEPSPSGPASASPERLVASYSHKRLLDLCLISAVADRRRQAQNLPISRHFSSGANRDRTGDLLLAKRSGGHLEVGRFGGLLLVIGERLGGPKYRHFAVFFGGMWTAKAPRST